MQLSDRGKTILKYTLGIALSLGTGVLAYFIFVNKTASGQTLFQKWTGKQPGQPDISGKPDTTVSSQFQSGATTKPTTTSTGQFPVGIGATGDVVKNIQKYVNATNVLTTPLVVDGSFGSLTSAGVKLTGYSVPVSQSDYNKMIK